MNPTSTPPPRPALNFTPSPKEKAGNKVGEGKQNKEVFGKPQKTPDIEEASRIKVQTSDQKRRGKKEERDRDRETQ